LPRLEPYEDQWAYLSTLDRLGPDKRSVLLTGPSVLLSVRTWRQVHLGHAAIHPGVRPHHRRPGGTATRLRHTIEGVVEGAGSRLAVTDMRSHGREIDVAFAAELTAKQGAAVSVMLAHDDGILVTPPGSGKTVIACAVIAERVPPPLPSPTGNP
jgi:hypothetical protein